MTAGSWTKNGIVTQVWPDSLSLLFHSSLPAVLVALLCLRVSGWSAGGGLWLVRTLRKNDDRLGTWWAIGRAEVVVREGDVGLPNFGIPSHNGKVPHRVC